MTKPGPALKQLHSHHAIHEGGLSGAIQKTNNFLELLSSRELEAANLAADDLLDYWETRVISHADAEESGFYQEKVEENPALRDVVIKLERDHDLLRIISKDIKEIRNEHGLNEAVIQRFYALLTVNEIHSRDEERLLF
ncbi:hemerythrin domain-containing protein [Psychrobacillus psychrodurans]|uniref:Hemerythrin domain-containing protein n=1 Tax=Psychrobacillus psychrodurans TaxID=126157 RepID=A0A9X3L718_9BACI|nr:hemerythrin domain-containing protein [Psychrobacillus psychrodurans]MCZ8532408.1 hemerythrin domain-containing protein [Psychrobacillus psychrodurans]